MKTRIALTAFLLVALAAFIGCDSADNPIAPTGSVITVSANPTQISLNGQSSTITITGFRPDGNPLNPGTQITLSTSNGLLRQSNSVNGAAANVVEIQNGRATVYLFGEGRQGAATVTASLTSGGDAATATVDVQIGTDDSSKPIVEVTANPSDVAVGETSTITVQARNADNSILSGATVNLRTSLGTLANVAPVTDSNGQAQTTLTATQSGTATVTASVGSSDEKMADVTFGTTRKPVVTLTANPSSIEDGETSEITVTARDENGNLLGDVVAIMSADRGFLTGGNFNSSTDELRLQGGRGTVNFTATGPPGTGSVTSFVQNSDIANADITIRGIPARINLAVSASSIPVGTAGTITFTATIVNSDSIRLEDESVSFSAFCTVSGSEVTFDPNFNPNPAFTNSNGVATASATFNTDNDTPPANCDGTEFTVQAEAREDENGNRVIAQSIIQIGAN